MFNSTLASLALVFAPFQNAPQDKSAPKEQANAPAQAAALDLVGPIRAGVRWLRSKQDPVTGAYAGDLLGTAAVVEALATSPDRYRTSDGPFVRKAAEFIVLHAQSDGAICKPDSTSASRVMQTRAAAEALIALGDPAHKEILGRALAFVAKSELPEGPAPDYDDWSVEQLNKRAAETLKSQVEPGVWNLGAWPAEAATAIAIQELSQIERLLKRHSASAAGASAKIEKLPEFTAVDREAALKALVRGADFLATTSQGGKWGAPGKPDAGMTAMALAALQTRPTPRPEAQQKLIDDGLAWLATLQKPDGSIHDGKLANYITSSAILAFARSGDAQWKPVLEKARGFLQTLQADEGEGYSEGDLYYGGIGYGSTERPDLSNLQMALEALSASGLDANAPTYKKALKFLERCQNRSESNDLKLVDGEVVIASGNDGGASYAPGDSKAGFVELESGVKVARSYGSMTYALVKCMLFAGLSKDDPRVVAAVDWCKQNYTLDVNPGFDTSSDPSAPYQGLFYYLLTMAQALDALGVETLTTSSGSPHTWRQEVCGRMVSMQSKLDGSWINHNSPRWYEGNPLLGTAYALLTLDAALPAAN